MQTSLTRSLSPNVQKIISVIIFTVLFAALVWASRTFLPFDAHEGEFALGVDWYSSFHPATVGFLQGESPYIAGKGIFNPPWLFVLLAPLAPLPIPLGAAFVFVFGFFAYGFILYRMGASLPVILAFVFAPLAMDNSGMSNIDSLCALGFLMPPQIGLFFVLIKPQIGVAVAAWWFFEAWRAGRVREVVRVFAPVTIALALSFVAYGWWFMPAFTVQTGISWNTSWWPLSIPVGIVLLATAVRRRKIGLSISASPFLSPYVAVDSWVVALLGLDPKSIEFKLALGALWVLRIAGVI